MIFSSHCFQGYNELSSMKNNDRTYLLIFPLFNGLDICAAVKRPVLALTHNKLEKM